jgi:very-short-patch-repair endonuclease
MEPDKDHARSHLERLVVPLVRKARLPKPDLNHPIAARARDFVWHDQRLVVEADGYRYHASRRAKRRDNRRDRELTALGWRPCGSPTRSRLRASRGRARAGEAARPAVKR